MTEETKKVCLCGAQKGNHSLRLGAKCDGMRKYGNSYIPPIKVRKSR